MQQSKPWMFQLLSVACISLAAKMEETEVPILLDLQVLYLSPSLWLSERFFVSSLSRLHHYCQLEPHHDSAWASFSMILSLRFVCTGCNYQEYLCECTYVMQVQDDVKQIFEVHTIQRMELLVLSTLEWRMSTVTPFSYIDYYFHKLGISNTLLRALLSRVSEIILATARGVLSFWHRSFKDFSTTIGPASHHHLHHLHCILPLHLIVLLSIVLYDINVHSDIWLLGILHVHVLQTPDSLYIYHQ